MSFVTAQLVRCEAQIGDGKQCGKRGVGWFCVGQSAGFGFVICLCSKHGQGLKRHEEKGAAVP